MARYINADALIKKVFPYDVVDPKCYTINAKLIYEAINKAPTADVVPFSEYDALKEMLKATIAGQETLQKALAERVEVVRCKDCEYVTDHGLGGLWCDHPDNRNPCGCRPADFCNDGKRRG